MEMHLTPQASIHLPRLAELVRAEDITRVERVYEFKLADGAELGHRPGQFVEVSLFGIGEAPISISSSPTKRGTFEIAVRAVGNVTNALQKLEVGSTVGIRGPFGNGFPVEEFKNKDLLIVAGGIGLFPVRSLINFVRDNRAHVNRLIIVFGCRRPEERLFCDELATWSQCEQTEFLETVDTCDESWTGNVGVVTSLFPKIDIDAEDTYAVVVGPPVMYRFVVNECLKKGIPEDQIVLSLERRMKCGVGKCGHCQMDGSYVCQDGPVYTYSVLKQMKEAI